MKLYEQAWKESEAIFEAIINHPFNQELMNSTLSMNKFAYYIEQDSLYLKDYAKALSLIATRLDNPEHVKDFLNFSLGAYIAEEEVVHKFFREEFNLVQTNKISNITLGYTSYLLKSAWHDDIEVAIAAVLPCFTIYKEVGTYIYKESVPNNHYQKWIETYASEEFAISVQKAIDIFNYLAEKASEQTKEAMLKAYYTSSCFELYFWNDAYNEKSFYDFKKYL